MTWFKKAFTSSVGKKFLLGLTGLGLVGFLVEHLAGNLLMYQGQDAFNGYAHLFEASGFLLPAELALLLLFLFHIILAVTVTIENKISRPEGYAVYDSKGGRTLASSTMIYSGILMLIFLVLHLTHFRFGVDTMDFEGRRDLYGGVLSLFQNPWWVVGYIVAVCVVGLHVSHGFQSALRSIGLNHPKYTLIIEWLSRCFGIVIAVGFSSFAIWAHFFEGGGY